jgi:2-dehydro-3-deoxyphosphogluconate aldolase/(4S)-4-hydroxy-2-oxoglutarate aldolase
MDIDRFKAMPVMGIIRTSGRVDMEALVEAVVRSGLETIEVAMNSGSAADLIRRAARSSHNRLMIGAGTVLKMETLKEALDAGASFVVMPVLVREIVDYCAKNAIPVFPGAFTPQEVYDAWNAGATMVKVFPAAMFGPAYIRELKAPMDRIELLACGGVTSANIRTFFECGASAVAFGSSIFKKDAIERGDFDAISRSIKELIDAR